MRIIIILYGIFRKGNAEKEREEHVLRSTLSGFEVVQKRNLAYNGIEK